MKLSKNKNNYKYFLKSVKLLYRRIQEKARLAKETIRKERHRLYRLNTVYIYLTVLLMVCLALLIVALKVCVLPSSLLHSRFESCSTYCCTQGLVLALLIVAL